MRGSYAPRIFGFCIDIGCVGMSLENAYVCSQHISFRRHSMLHWPVCAGTQSR